MATRCPTQTDLEGLLDGKLPSATIHNLTDHIGVCVGCQEKLEGLACEDPHFSSEVVRHIDKDEPPKNSAFWKALDSVEIDGTRTSLVPAHLSVSKTMNGSVSDTDHPSGELKLDFLQPPEQPGDLGKLGDFRIFRVVGRGGMGVVLHAFDPCLQRDVAIKVLDPQLAGNETARARFCREARAAAAVTHENLVAVHQVDEDATSGLPYLIMQLVVGESLDERLKRLRKLSVPEVAHLGMQAAAGLAAAHAGGLIHRDIKPGNILIEKDTDRVKLTDFGLARAAEDVKLTRTGFVAGTPLYMAPEQARGDEVDARADLFSLGTVLYEAVAGKPPFDGKTPLAVLRRVADEAHTPLQTENAETPFWLSDVIDRLLEKDPADRFQSASEVAELFAAELARFHSLSALDVPAEVCSLSRSHSNTRRRKQRGFHAWCVAKRALPWAAGIFIGGFAVALADWSRTTAPMMSYPSPPSFPGQADDPGPPPIATLEGKAGPVYTLDFSPDNKTLVVGFQSGDVKFWNLQTNSFRGQLSPLEGTVWAVQFSPNGESVLTASSDSQVIIWDTDTYSKQKTLPQTTAVKSAAFSPDGNKVATGDMASTLWLWNLKTDVPFQIKAHRGEINAVAFSPDGKLLASAGVDRTVKIWEVRGDQLSLKRTLEHDAAVYGVTFSPDGTRVASGSLDGKVRIWNASNGGLIHPMEGQSKKDVWSVSFNHDGSLLASTSLDGTVTIWDANTGLPLHTLRAGPDAVLHAGRFARKGSHFAAGSRASVVRVWDVAELPKK